MKNALSIYGQLRGDKTTWDSILKYLIYPLNADVFIHTWSAIENKYYVHNISKFIDTYNDSESYKIWYEQQLLRQCTSTKNLQECINIVNPKKILIEEQIIFNNEEYFDNNSNTVLNEAISYQNAISQSFSRQKSINLIIDYEKENLIKYDNIYQTRSDILFENFVIPINKNGIYSNFINDTLYYGDRNSMIKFSNMYDEYFKLLLFQKDLNIAFMEIHIDNYIKKLGINKNIIILPFTNNGIKRCL